MDVCDVTAQYVQLYEWCLLTIKAHVTQELYYNTMATPSRKKKEIYYLTITIKTDKKKKLVRNNNSHSKRKLHKKTRKLQ